MFPDNPIKQTREARGLSRNRFAMLAGLTYSQVTAVEAGRLASVPEAWRAGLDAAGFDRDALDRDYRAWRAGLTARAEKAAANGG